MNTVSPTRDLKLRYRPIVEMLDTIGAGWLLYLFWQGLTTPCGSDFNMYKAEAVQNDSRL